MLSFLSIIKKNLIPIMAITLSMVVAILFTVQIISAKLPAPIMPKMVHIKTAQQGFWIGKYEISRKEWAFCYKDGGCSHQPRRRAGAQDDHPVTDINWWDARQYASWLSKRTGHRYRLPTSREWVFAAAGALKKKPKLFTDPRLAWAADYNNYELKPKKTQSRGSFGENKQGVADIAGNVWEWTSDCAAASQNTKESVDDRSCFVRVIQGEHKGSLLDLIRDPLNGGCGTGIPPSNLGFRLVRIES